MTYRERRLARAERLREWSEKREAKANAAHDGVHAIADQIPFGQPILVGHHSERRARRDQARMESGMRAAIDHSDKAKSMSSRADNIEAAVERAIYDDDPDAVERLAAKVAELTAKRDAMKAANADYRKAHRDELKAMGPYERSQSVPYPSYAITNIGATIRTAAKRLESLRRGPVERPMRTIVARYAGRCDACGEPIHRGDLIDYKQGEPVVHTACPEGGTA
jgi:phage host-nuclease inhibitor protein Gam